MCAHAQQPPPIRFDVSGYAVEGAPQLSADDFSRLIAPFIGKQKSAADLQRAQQAVQQAYLDLGHCSIQVTLPKAEPVEGTVTLRLVQSPLPVAKDCLPMVVLDSGAPVVSIAPGEVATRPLGDLAQSAAESSAPVVEAPSRIARAPLKPLQDRPSSGAISAPQAKPEIPAAPTPRDTPVDVTVQPLAQASTQAPLIVMPSVPVQIERPVAPSPKATVAAAPLVLEAPKPPVAPVIAAAPLSAQQPAPSPVAPAPSAPVVVALAPVKRAVSLPPPAVEPPKVQSAMNSEIALAPVTPPVIAAPRLTESEPAAAPVPTQEIFAPAIAVAPSIAAPKVEAPKPAAALTDTVVAAKPPDELTPATVAPPVVAAAPVVKPVPEIVAATPVLPAPATIEPVVVTAKPAAAAVTPRVAIQTLDPVKERTTAPTSPPVVADATAAIPIPEVIAAAPVKPAPLDIEPPVVVTQPAAPAVAPQLAIQSVEPVKAPTPSIAERLIETAAPAFIAAAPAATEKILQKSAPAVESTEAVTPSVAPPKVAAASPLEITKPLPSPVEVPVEKISPVTPPVLALRPAAAPTQPASTPLVEVPRTVPFEPSAQVTPPPAIEVRKEQVAAKVEPNPVAPTPPTAAEVPVLKSAPVVMAVAPVTPEPAATNSTVVLPAVALSKPPPSAEKLAPPQQFLKPVVEPPKEQAVVVQPTPVPTLTPSSAPEPVIAKPATPDVEVRPFAGAVATAVEPRETTKAVPERAPVRPLQDRQPAQEPAVVAQAAPPQPVAKPAPVIVSAPATAPAVESAASSESTAAPAALKFDIDRYVVEGNTLLNQQDIARVLAGYTGKEKDFADVQRALEALQVVYQTRGWGVVQVSLPEQELERGEVRFEVTETKIGKVAIQGNEFVTDANVRRSVPNLKEGLTPNSLAIAQSLKVANESPAKQSQVSLKAGANDGEVDATIKVVDENPRKYSLSFDNTGTDSTGRFRLGFGFQHSNLWDRDHQLTMQYITSPEHPSKVTVLGAGYHVPLYGLGDSIDVILGYSDVDSGTVQQLFNVSGAGLIVLGRYNMNLKRIDEYEHKITFGLDYKAFQSRVLTTSGVALVPDITLRPLSLAYSGEFRDDKNAFNFYTSFSHNAFEGGNDAAQSDFKASRGAGGGASAEYSIWRAGVNYQRLLPEEFTFRFAANAQTTRNALVAGEQFGIGGANSVRGFNERIYSNDKGSQATFELITPDVAGKLGLDGGRLKFLAFYDTGTLGRNFIQPGEQIGLAIDSVGVGLRLTFKERLSLRIDYAQVMHDGGMDSGRPDGRRNSNTLHASALFVY